MRLDSLGMQSGLVLERPEKPIETRQGSPTVWPQVRPIIQEVEREMDKIYFLP